MSDLLSTLGIGTKRRRWALVAVVVAAISAVALLMGLGGDDAQPIRVGVLHSLSGSMAMSARPVVESTLMAIDELNAAGGVLGRPSKRTYATAPRIPPSLPARPNA